MRSNFFKYLFILFAIVIIIYSIYTIYFKEKKEEESNEDIEVVEEIDRNDIILGVSNYDTINPLITSNKEILNLDKLIFEPLVTLSDNYKLEMCLATEISKISDTTYVVKIDNNKKWSDGSSVIAKDIQFTIDRIKEGTSVYAYNVEKVSSVEVIDSDTIKIILNEPVPFFEYNLTFPILSNNYYLGEDFYASQKTPMGTGMFKISKIESNNIELEKNDRWWNLKNKNSKIEKIDIKIFSEIGEVYNSFKLGNIDIISTSNGNIENYVGTIGYNKYEYKSRDFNYLAFNCGHSLLQNEKIRKAIGLAIDKTNITTSVFANNCTVSQNPLDYGSFLYEENTLDATYNQEQAKITLEDDGWAFKNSRWQKTENYRTQKISLSLTVNKEDIQRVSVAENIKGQLAQVGIPVTLNKVSASQYKNILQNKNYEMILTGVYNSYTPNLRSFFGEDNLQNYYNEEITNIMGEVENITDNNLLIEKIHRILEIYNDELPFVSLYRGKGSVVKLQNVIGEVKPNSFFSYYNINEWGKKSKVS